MTLREELKAMAEKARRYVESYYKVEDTPESGLFE